MIIVVFYNLQTSIGWQNLIYVYNKQGSRAAPKWSESIFQNHLVLSVYVEVLITLLQQEKLIQAVEEAGIRKNGKGMVGGAPVTETYTKKIDANSYAEDAIISVDFSCA